MAIKHQKNSDFKEKKSETNSDYCSDSLPVGGLLRGADVTALPADDPVFGR